MLICFYCTDYLAGVVRMYPGSRIRIESLKITMHVLSSAFSCEILKLLPAFLIIRCCCFFYLKKDISLNNNKLRSSGPLSKVKVEWQDERYSTVEAEEVLIEANMSREDRKKIIDRQAAIVILQRYLDRMPRKEENDE